MDRGESLSLRDPSLPLLKKESGFPFLTVLQVMKEVSTSCIPRAGCIFRLASFPFFLHAELFFSSEFRIAEPA